MGEGKIGLVFVSLFSKCCWTMMRCSQKRKGWLSTRLVTGAARNGLGGRKTTSHSFAPGNTNDLHIPWSTSWASPSSALFKPLHTPPTQPQCAVQINQQFTGGMAIKGNSKTSNNFLKPKNIIHGGEHFSSVCFFKCKSSDFFKQKQHLGINSGTWVLGGYRYASWIFLPLLF